MPRKKKDLKALQSLWYSKLKKSGFEDIEVSETKLKRYDAEYFLAKGADEATETVEYYNECEEFLRRHVFFSKSDRLVWRLHCTGLTEEEIAKQLKVQQPAISKVLARLTKVMLDERSNNDS